MQDATQCAHMMGVKSYKFRVFIGFLRHHVTAINLTIQTFRFVSQSFNARVLSSVSASAAERGFWHVLPDSEGNDAAAARRRKT